MKRQLVKGSTGVVLEVFIQDTSSTTGAGLTGLVFNSAGLTCSYHRNLAVAAVAVALVTMTVGTFTSSGFKEIDSVKMPGHYQLCLPNAAFATGAESFSGTLLGAANMMPCPLEVTLTGIDMQDGVRGGMTALPAAAAEGAGGLFTRGTGAGQINQTVNGLINSNLIDIVGAAVATGTAQLGVNVVQAAGTAWNSGAIIAATLATDTITAAKIAANAITAAKIATGAIAAATFAAGAIDSAAIADNAIDAATFAAGTIATAADIADAVLDEVLSGHLTPGTAGKALSDAGSGGDPWSTLLPGAYGAGTAGKIVGDNINATISSRLAPTVAARTLDVTALGNAGIDWGNVENPTTANNLSGTNIATSQVVSSVSGAVGSVTGAVGSVTAGVALTAGERNSVADALLDRTDAIEVGLTLRGYTRLSGAKQFGKLSGGSTGNETFRNAIADTKDRLIFSDDASGNRSVVVAVVS